MYPQPPRPSDADEPLDAIVYDVHPALGPARAQGDSPFAQQQGYPYGAYPYGSPLADRSAPPDSRELANSLGSVLSEMLRPLHVDLGRKADYVVPQRFGMSALLGIMTALAVLFGFLRLLDAYPSVYFFFGLQAVVICIAQMFQGQSPRRASVVAGAILLPLFALYTFMFFEGGPSGGLLCVLVFAIPAGAFLGYLTGTCAAGVFLLMDVLERYIKGQHPMFQPAGPALPGATPGALP